MRIFSVSKNVTVQHSKGALKLRVCVQKAGLTAHQAAALTK